MIIVLDCAPTPSLRFVSMPTTLGLDRKPSSRSTPRIAQGGAPAGQPLSPVDLPTDNYFATAASLFGNWTASLYLWRDPPHQPVVWSTNFRRKWCYAQRSVAFVYFSLARPHGRQSISTACCRGRYLLHFLECAPRQAKVRAESEALLRA